MQRWDEVEQWLKEEAEADLLAGQDSARPCLAAYRGHEPLFVAFLRRFEKGRYHDAVIELLALAIPLQANQLAMSMTGRAWSLDDPIVPVSEEGDLRQRVLMIESADSTSGAVESLSVIFPFEQTAPGAPLRWGDRIAHGGAQGWIPGALRIAVQPETHRRMHSTDADMRQQAARIQHLGHLLALAPSVSTRLRLAVRRRGLR